MARRAKSVTLAEEIAKTQTALVKAQQKVDAIKDHLQDLLDKQDAIRNQELIDAVANSKRSFDEIISFIKADPSQDDENVE